MVYNASSCPVAFLVADAEHVLHSNHTSTAEQLAKELSAHPSSLIYAGVLLLCSLFVLFFGARLVRPALFLASAFTTALLALAFVPSALAAAPIDENAACIVVGVAPIAIGLVAGAVAMCFLNAGFAFLGAGAGAGLGYTLYAAVLNRWPLETVDAQGTTLMYLLCVFVGALLGASVLLRHEIEVMIGATSLVGAVGSTAALALLLAHVDVKFLGGFKPSLQASHEVYVWAQAAAVVVLFLLGIIVQYRHARKRAERDTVSLRNHQVPLMVP